MSTTVALKNHSPMLTADGADLLALVELALAEARTLGASQAEAAISMDVGLSVSARLGEVETIEYQFRLGGPPAAPACWRPMSGRSWAAIDG